MTKDDYSILSSTTSDIINNLPTLPLVGTP